MIRLINDDDAEDDHDDDGFDDGGDEGWREGERQRTIAMRKCGACNADRKSRATNG